jgi:hypothetical protein
MNLYKKKTGKFKSRGTRKMRGGAWGLVASLPN